MGRRIFVQVYATRLMRANDMPRVGAFPKDIERIGNTVFLPASIVVLVLGVSMVWYSPAWELTQLWVILGLIGIANTIVVGAAFLGPESAGSAVSRTSAARRTRSSSDGSDGSSRSRATTSPCWCWS